MSVAFGCYTPEAWARLYEVVADPETLADSYEDFLESAEEKIKAIEARGLTTAKILIDPDHMAAGRKRQGIVLDSSARAAYGAAVACVDGDKDGGWWTDLIKHVKEYVKWTTKHSTS